MSAFHFLHPDLLWSLLLTLPLGALFWHIAYKLAWSTRDAYGERQLLQGFAHAMGYGRHVFRMACCLLVVLLATIAAAGPTVRAMPEHVPAGSTQVVAIINVDPGMAAEDYRGQLPVADNGLHGQQGNRVQAALYQIQHGLMPAIDGNKLGFVTYMGSAFIQAHLTNDFTALNFIINSSWIKAGVDANGTDVGSAPCCGDEVAVALQKAAEMFEESDNSSNTNAERVIILFGDGGFSSSWADIEKAVTKLNEKRVHLLVVGTGNQALSVPVYQDDGIQVGNVKFDDKIGVSGFYEQNLQKLSQLSTNGSYVHIDSGDQGIDWPLSMTMQDRAESADADLYYVPLGLALCILVGLSFSIPPRNSRANES
jgi:hypothetical protein